MKKYNIFMPENHMDNLYNSKNPLVRFVFNNKLKTINKIIEKENGVTVLDAGCGEGHLIDNLYNYNNNNNKYLGVDITDEALKEDLSRFSAQEFDVVICTDVLEHSNNCTLATIELKRVLKKQGKLIITFPNEFLWTVSRFLLGRKPIKVPDHVNSFNPRKIEEMVNMKRISLINLPFRLPFFLSLSSVMVFENV